MHIALTGKKSKFSFVVWVKIYVAGKHIRDSLASLKICHEEDRN
jgi:hypothetical protein